MDHDIRQLVSGLPDILEAMNQLLDSNGAGVSDMVRASAAIIRKEVCLLWVDYAITFAPFLAPPDW